MCPSYKVMEYNVTAKKTTPDTRELLDLSLPKTEAIFIALST